MWHGMAATTYDSERTGVLRPAEVTTTRGDCNVSKPPRTVAARSSSEIGRSLSIALRMLDAIEMLRLTRNA